MTIVVRLFILAIIVALLLPVNIGEAMNCKDAFHKLELVPERPFKITFDNGVILEGMQYSLSYNLPKHLAEALTALGGEVEQLAKNENASIIITDDRVVRHGAKQAGLACSQRYPGIWLIGFDGSNNYLWAFSHELVHLRDHIGINFYSNMKDGVPRRIIELLDNTVRDIHVNRHLIKLGFDPNEMICEHIASCDKIIAQYEADLPPINVPFLELDPLCF